jgi:UDP-glucose 4-epimerase|tara:strand:- start:413 stop:1297 length:885 start_codon:yes stop_codon:yes gene_type:complete
MKMLVTGGAGFVGTNLIIRLMKDGHEVVSVDNYSTGKKENHQEGCQYHDFDLSSPHTLGIYVDHGSYPHWRDEKYDVIFHIGALARIQPSLRNPYKSIFNNFVSSLNIFEYARRNNIKVVYAGSSTFHHGLYSSPYAWSKYSGEELCKLYSSVYDLSTAICRFYNVYGPYQLEDGDYSTVLGIFEKQYREGKPLTITADGEQRRDFTYIDDIVDGLVKCSEHNFKAEFFELGKGVNYSINEIADMFGKDYPREYISARKGEYDVTLADYSKAKLKLGWEPKGDITQYIKSIIEV